MSELSRLEAGSAAPVISSSSSRSIDGGRALELLNTADRAMYGEVGCSLCATGLYAML